MDGEGEPLRGVGLTEETIATADCVVIVTDHRKIDYGWVAERAALLVDTRNATRDLRDGQWAEKILRL